MNAATERQQVLKVTRILGLDPGLRRTGWGVLEASGNRLRHLGHGVVTSADKDRLSERLLQIHRGLAAIIAEWRPDVAAVEETFVNRNPVSTLKLGQVRGVVMLAPALAGLDVHEYAPNMVKKSVAGSGHAEKAQIRAMVHRLLPGIAFPGSDAADALAIAICHAHTAQTRAHWSLAAAPAGTRSTATAKAIAKAKAQITSQTKGGTKAGAKSAGRGFRSVAR